ncbi:MAG: 4Fe-4S dicluster domain-containing protein [Lachnospiraceae bacterium]|nr:4Fe-4S dicluster domain-containing protein [Lachnospiraceae bacterium]
MNVIDFRASRCRHCYKCVRACSLKAIRVKDGHAGVLADRCILCGRCLSVCPQNAKTVHSERGKAAGFLKEGIPVIASVAPSESEMFAGAGRGRLVCALKKLGFAAVRETSEGAAFVTREYKRQIEAGGRKNLLTTCCPGAVELVEKYYPSQIGALLPVVSPMTAHARLLKEEADGPVRVVFLGPCIAKKREAADERNPGGADAVLTFQELEDWLEEEGIALKDCEPSEFDNPDPAVNRLYPATGGILASLAAFGTDFGPYRRLAVDGLDSCMRLLEDMENGKVENCLIELSICEDGCLNGPAAPKAKSSLYQMKADLKRDVSKKETDSDWFAGRAEPKLAREFADRHMEEPRPSEEEIRDILRRIGKMTGADELNCGACGYPSCRAKAVAVYQGKAEIEMCIPYMHEKAESLANVVMDTTPNAVLLIAPNMDIREASASARRLFGKNGAQIVGRNLKEFIVTEAVEQVFASHENRYTEKHEYLEFGRIVLQTLVYVKELDMVLAIFVDITEEEERARKDQEQRLEMVAMAQKVIDRQMMVAQEIAGLLGETTAETKVTLTKISRSLLEETPERGNRL